jgi:chromate transporter
MSARVAWLALVFAQLSFFAVGGANSIIPEIQRHFVDAPGGIDGPLFASLVAIAQAAPGPNAMLVGLVGWHVAGGAGAFAATMGFCGPPALLTLVIGRAWVRFRETRLGSVVLDGVAPLIVGLVLASGWSLIRAQGFRPLLIVITVISALGSLRYAGASSWFLAMGAVVAVAFA